MSQPNKDRGETVFQGAGTNLEQRRNNGTAIALPRRPVHLSSTMTQKSRIILVAAAVALTTLTLNAKWVSTWAEEAAGKKAHDQDTYRLLSPSGDIRSVACSADGKTLFVVCSDGWIKGPAGKGYGTKFQTALFKSTDGGETWTVLKGD